MDIIEWPHVEIPLSDGTVLAARIWLPADAAKRPVPAILEYLPYRKRDGTAVRDELTYPWFAERGYAERPGRWVATNGWPDKLVEMHSFALADGARLICGAGDLTEPVPVCTPLTAGTGQGEYCAIWVGPDLPTDQRADDAYAATWDTDPLTTAVDVLGQPEVALRVASTTDAGQLTVRLNDVRPDCAVAMITYGVLNLHLRDSLVEVSPVVAGEPMDVNVTLDMVGYRLPAGHRLRVSVSSANFPLLMPPPVRSDLVILPGSSGLMLPTFTGPDLAEPLPPPVSAPGARLHTHRQAAPSRTVTTDVATGETRVVIHDDLGDVTFEDHGLRVAQRCREEYVAHPEHADHWRAQIDWSYEVSREGQFNARVESTYRLSCDVDVFHLEAEQVAHCDGQPAHSRTWREDIPRISG